MANINDLRNPKVVAYRGAYLSGIVDSKVIDHITNPDRWAVYGVYSKSRIVGESLYYFVITHGKRQRMHKFDTAEQAGNFLQRNGYVN